MMKKYFYAFAIVLMSFTVAQNALAVVGISPAGIETQVIAEAKTEQVFYISRSDASKEEKFTAVSRDPHLDLRGQTELIMPEGEQIVPFLFDIDSRGLALGKYTGQLLFTPVQIESGSTDQITLIISITGSVEYEVVESLPEVVNLEPAVKVINATLQQSISGQVIKFNLKNVSDQPLENVRYRLKVLTKKGILVQEHVSHYTYSFVGGEQAEYAVALDPLEYGEYSYRIVATYDGNLQSEEFTSEFTARRPDQTSWRNVATVGSVVLLVLGLLTILGMPRHKHR